MARYSRHATYTDALAVIEPAATEHNADKLELFAAVFIHTLDGYTRVVRLDQIPALAARYRLITDDERDTIKTLAAKHRDVHPLSNLDVARLDRDTVITATITEWLRSLADEARTLADAADHFAASTAALLPDTAATFTSQAATLRADADTAEGLLR